MIFFTKGGMKPTHLRKCIRGQNCILLETKQTWVYFLTLLPRPFFWGGGGEEREGEEGGGIHWWIEKGKKNQAFYVISVSVFGIIEE